MFSTILVAVAAFKRVEPVNTSGPGTISIVKGVIFLISLCGLHTIAHVAAFMLWAYFQPPITKGVRPLAAIPITI